MNLRLYAWQEECLSIWHKNGRKGIINVVTGAGKTALAAAAVESLSGVGSLKIKIVVPKTFLVSQWARALREYLQIPREEIGVYTGPLKNTTDKKFMIYVINSARYSLARHILNDLSAGNPVFLIADECHRYGSDENSRIFDFCPWRLGAGGTTESVYTLGLSATPYCEHYGDVLVPCLGPEIYRFSFNRALKEGIISKFAVFYIRLQFSRFERSVYDELTDKLNKTLTRLRIMHPDIRTHNSSLFFKELSRIAGDADESSGLARAALMLTYQRKGIVCEAKARVSCVFELLRLIRDDAKIIIFGERIETADEIYSGLKTMFPHEAGVYHSGVHKDVGEVALRSFENGQTRILVSCRTLDEGLSVTGADVGIIVSSTNSNRQRIQRLGRVLRKKNGCRPAYFYYLYVDDTTEESDVFRDCADGTVNMVSFIDLDFYNGAFSNAFYDNLTNAVLARAVEKGWREATLTEMKHNFKNGIIACDWLMTKKDCEEYIKLAKNRRERNYYTAMLYLITEREKDTNGI